jgi:hypothetical protein
LPLLFAIDADFHGPGFETSRKFPIFLRARLVSGNDRETDIAIGRVFGGDAISAVLPGFLRERFKRIAAGSRRSGGIFATPSAL